jgi:hypothetical protein
VAAFDAVAQSPESISLAAQTNRPVPVFRIEPDDSPQFREFKSEA